MLEQSLLLKTGHQDPKLGKGVRGAAEGGSVQPSAVLNPWPAGSASAELGNTG